MNRFTVLALMLATSVAHSTTDPTNEFCPVMPGVAANPEISAVVDGKQYIFGSTACRARFLAATDAYLAAMADRRGVSREPVHFENATVTFFGEIIHPANAQPHAAAVIIHGSGDADHRHSWAQEIATGLAARGIATLIHDKRGNGKTGGSWRNTTREDLARDAIAAETSLTGHEQFGHLPTGFVGLSEGGSIAPIAGTLSEHADFVISLSSSALPLMDAAFHQYLNGIKNHLTNKHDQNQALAVHEALEQHVSQNSPATWIRYDELRNSAENSSELRDFLEGLPVTGDSWHWDWWRGVYENDPMDYWTRLEMPGLFVSGRLDDLANVAVGDSIRRISRTAPHVDTMVIDNVAHGLRPDGLPITARTFDLLAQWIGNSVLRSSPDTLADEVPN